MKLLQYLSFLVAAAASATSDTKTTKLDEDVDLNTFLVEEGLVASPEWGEHALLRRETQALDECRPVPGTGPVTDFICGWGAGPPGDVCGNFQGTCAQRLGSYPCTCGTNTTTTNCHYCQIRTAHGVVCIKTGARITFPGQTGVNSCHCLSLSNGSNRANCTLPLPPTNPPTSPRATLPPTTPRPATPRPTVRPTTRAPVATCKARSVACTSHAQCCSKHCGRDKKKRRFHKGHRRVCRSPPRM